MNMKPMTSLRPTPPGRVTDKAQDRTDLSSGDYKIQSEQLSDLRVHVYGNVAVAAATNLMKGTYKGQDLSGKYRFTDTWVKRNGKWWPRSTPKCSRFGQGTKHKEAGPKAPSGGERR